MNTNTLIAVAAVGVVAVVIMGPSILSEAEKGISNAVSALSNLKCNSSTPDNQVGLCYKNCNKGYNGLLTICWAECGDEFISGGGKDDGAYCRKGTVDRGVGKPIHACGDRGKYSTLVAGLCKEPCKKGYKLVGTSCMEICKEGYNDDGLTCRKDPQTINADTSRCPWYNKCSQFGANCSTCPPGWDNLGCTCMTQAHIYGKDIYTDAGVPMGCDANEQYDAGLCYKQCPPKFKGVGPVCWQNCPANTRDVGVSCEKDSYSRGVGVPMEFS